MNTFESIDTALAQVERYLATWHPRANPHAVLSATRAFLLWRGRTGGVPDVTEAARYLDNLAAARDATAAERDFSWLLMAAPALWRKQDCALLAGVLRTRRARPKAARRTAWDKAEQTICSLPPGWQTPFREVLARSRSFRRGDTGLVWSASRPSAVAAAAARWCAQCRRNDTDPARPTGAALEAYAAAAVAGGVSVASAANYIERIHAAVRFVVTPGAFLPGCAFVVEDWRQRGAGEAPVSKTAAGIVPASAIYDLAFDIMASARAAPIYGTRAAQTYRDGLLLAVASAVPERARALSALDFASTFRLGPPPEICIALPGHVLKRPERRKLGAGLSMSLHNAALWDALEEYRTVFRPIFDDGTALFPSQVSPGAALSEQRLSTVIRHETGRHLGVVVSIHRVRDCVGTEAAETFLDHAMMGPLLLGHSRDAKTFERHYNHAEGLRAAHALADALARRQSRRPELEL